MMSSKKGTYKGLVVQQDGSVLNITLKDVLYVPELWINLLSLTKAINTPGVELCSKGNLIALKIGSDTILFDKELVNGSGRLLGVDISPRIVAESANVSAPPVMLYDQMHSILGHPGEQRVRATAKRLGITLRGEVHTCQNCAIAKSKQKNVPQVNTKKATCKGDRISIDISSVQAVSLGGAKFWLMIKDEFSDYVWSFFLKHKSDLPGKVMDWMRQLKKEMNIKINHIRCDNSGENKSLQQQIALDSSLSVKFEFVAPYTPEQNGSIERKFATIFGKTRAMLNAAQLPTNLRNKLWAQCASTASKLENVLSSTGEDLSASEKFYGTNPVWVKAMHSFGEICIVSDDQNKKIRSKLADRGIPCLFIGYPENHAADVFQFLKLDNEHMILSRNVIWLNKTFATYKGISGSTVTFEADSDIIELQEDDEPGPLVEAINPRRAPRLSRLEREVRNLTTSYNPNPGAVNEAANIAVLGRMFDPLPEMAMVAGFDDGSLEPRNYKEAMCGPNHDDWWKAMCVEFANMEEKGVWVIHHREKLPKNRKKIGNRWVYKQKDDGRFRARTVAKGFSQIPGKDFHENHAPVVNDTTFRLALALKLLLGLQSEQFDIETAFLYGDLEEDIWMEFPEGYSRYLAETGRKDFNNDDYCLELKKAIYGLVQAARQWWKKFKEVMAKFHFYPSAADPCLFIKHIKNDIAFAILYVDDGGIIGTQETIQALMKELSTVFHVKGMGPLKNFVGCHIIENDSKDTIWIHQPKLLKDLKLKFGAIAQESRSFKTPAAPRTIVMRPQEGDLKISVEKQSEYRSGVGMLLYLVKHSRPEISNAVRELSKVADGATSGHWKAMVRVIKYVLDTENHGLKLKPQKKGGLFYLEGISDSEYAGDKDTRISVYGYVLYFCGAPISWKSKSGKSVTLSSTEAEYFATSEVAKEVIFAKQVIESIGIEIQYPIEIKVDNTGAIYIANNYTTGQRTKHIDVRAHFVREYIEDGILKVLFVRTDDNDADIYTKNTSEEIFLKHSGKYMDKVDG
jgi:hypothetical protein